VELALTDGALAGLSLLPFRIRNFRLSRAPSEDAAWLQETLDRESAGFGTRVVLREGDRLSVNW
jgi:poly-gamma-glutamate synthesis protein (capsule biosynthesis protein)